MSGTISIIGAGRVGRALGRCLRELGWKIGAVVTRSEPTARKVVRSIGAGHAHAFLTRQVVAAQVILITTPDRSVAEVAEELARIGAEELRGKIVLHTSGALSSDVLDPLRQYGASVGSMHPLQTFSGVGVPPLDGKVFTIEGDAQAARIARAIARALGAIPVHIDGSKKPLYHAAGALAAGNVLVLMEAATRLMTAAGMKRREAVRALLPLTRQVLENFERLGPRAAWTGPLSRGDYGVVATHMEAMKDMPVEFARAYEAVNRLAALVLAQDSAAMLADLEKVVVNKKSKVKGTGGQG
ncbi:MAG TPA: DUF2520 domain-containing protein [Verrucomicrobiae bacterium]|jgi:predicted short-subunit dehydrogenase-like oxidoreductase (DUF2520 family)|nr:DUF2520 domain-containing protein [Verrucomicrobiae bacterium]